jgi:hypothetical protein
MIHDFFLSPWWKVFVVGCPLYMCILSIIYSLYLTRYLSEILRALENSRQVDFYLTIFKGLGIFGKGLLLSLIGGMLVWPKTSIRVGFLDANDVENFPPRLLRLMRVNMMLMAISAVWLGVVSVPIGLK